MIEHRIGKHELMRRIWFAFVLGLADQPRGTTAIHFNLRAEQAAAQRFGGGVEGFRATAGAFGHGLLYQPFRGFVDSNAHPIKHQINFSSRKSHLMNLANEIISLFP